MTTPSLQPRLTQAVKKALQSFLTLKGSHSPQNFDRAVRILIAHSRMTSRERSDPS
jgi:hypothetical protein